MMDFHPGEEITFDIPTLADEVISNIFFSDNSSASNQEHFSDQQYILIGHSYGAILAFEVAKRVKARGLKDPLVLFVSAARAPSSSSLTDGSDSKPVSEMDLHEISKYLKSKGSEDTTFDFTLDEHELELMLTDCIRADYKGLESYVPNNDTVSCLLSVICGEDDKLVSTDDLIGWKKHSTNDVDIDIIAGQGHFYLGDIDGAEKLANVILCKLGKVLRNHAGEHVNALKEIYGEVLNLDKECDALTCNSDFFELGGSSLDTIALIAQIEAKFGVLLTQNEFFLAPKICDLALRIMQLKQAALEFPKLAPLPDSTEDGKWFPTSHSQEQMIALWETSPSMYNMVTTIEFIEEAIDVDILHKAFAFVVEQQPTLRTIVKIQGKNKFMQCVLPKSRANECFTICICEVKNLKEVSEIIKTESHYIFPLYDPPIVRGVVIRNADGKDFLFLSQYHVGSDSWALVILRKQILEAYTSIKSSGSVNECQKMPCHPNFIDWTIWQRRCLNDFGQEEKQVRYWKDKLEGLPKLLLPLDKLRPNILGNGGLQIPIKIHSDVIKRFNTLVTSQGANLYAGLLTVYMCILQRLGGADDFAVGIALANRNAAGLHDLIGYFANEVTIRAKFKENDTFATLLQQVRENVLEGMANADVAFHDVVKALNVPRDSSSTPLFQAFFALQERKWWTLEDICSDDGNANKFELRNFSTHLSKFEVHMFIRNGEFGGIEGELTIATDLFDAHTGQRIADMFHLLVETVTAAPKDTSIYRHNLVTSSDRAISVYANSTDTEFDAPVQSILDWNFLDSSSPALVQDNEASTTVTYAELKLMVERVKTFLVLHVNNTSDTLPFPVGLLVTSNPQGLAAIYGVLAAGCSIVVVDPEKTTKERCKMIFEDAQVKLVFIDNDFYTQFETLSSDLDLTALHTVLSTKQQNISPIAVITPDSVFGYFYTSGTTGKPKGVIIKHGNVLNLVNWWISFFDLKSSDRILLFSSLSFIMSLRQYIPTLVSGGTIVLPKSSVEFESAILKGGVNKLICTPSALGVLDIEKVSKNIEAVQVAGEAPRLALMRAWKPKVKHLYIGLGPTELCAHALCGEFDGETICIGFPVDNCKAYIVEPKSHQEAAINVVGELWISGENVAHGYLNRSDGTNFFENPFESGLRCYRTGDLAKRMHDGRIQFLGRVDTQLKVNGLRIEAGEIINAIPEGLKSAHVVSENGNLTMYKTCELRAIDIKKALEEKLPKYMVPTKYFTVEAFPLNKNKKLDVAKLMEDGEESVTGDIVSRDDTVSETLLESTIKSIWVESLGKKDISLNADFFDVGGTSLSAVLVCRALCERLETDIAVQDIFAYPTIETFAKFIEENKGFAAETGDPRPLLFLPGGEKAMNTFLFNLLQGVGLAIMSIIVFLPVIATIFLSARSISLFGRFGSAFIPAILAGGAFLHMSLVFLSKWALIRRYRQGKAVLFSSYFLKWWLMRRIMQTCRLYSWAFDDSNLSRYFYILYGAQIGSNFSMENMYLLEPDLVSIGDNCVVEYEAQFCTSCIQNGLLELRQISVGNNVKIGTRSVLLGGCNIHDGCEVAPKTTVDHKTSSTSSNQILAGSPASILQVNNRRPNVQGMEKRWTYSKGKLFTLCQLMCDLFIVAIFATCLYIGAIIAFYIDEKFGVVGVVLFMTTLFFYTIGAVFLFIVALLKRLLLPRLKADTIYDSHWFFLRKWFLDRLFLSPVFALALSRCLETTTTYPFYLRLLGADLGNKVWLTYIHVRVGVEFLKIGDGVHTGMQTYINTATSSEEGVTFHFTMIGNETTCGQRSLILPGAFLGQNVTVGAETCVPEFFRLEDNGTILGSPPITFHTSKTNAEIVSQSQHLASTFHSRNNSEHNVIPATNSDKSIEMESFDIGTAKIPFCLYGFLMNLIQLILPIFILGPYIVVFYLIYLTAKTFVLSTVGIVLIVPATFILGSILLMGVIKIFQLAFFGGALSTGTIHYYSFKFMQWYILSDLVYLCTSTILVPFSGTELFCTWLRIMGSKIGKRVFISPENGGFRELDFLDVGNDCCILTPNLNSHYADRGIMQFCPTVLKEGCDINFGATIMPLTSYGRKCIISPFAVTTKGQHCRDNTCFVGNPCKPAKVSYDNVAILFGGLGSAYPGMLKEFDSESSDDMIQRASEIAGIDVKALCDVNAEANKLEDEGIAQIVVTVANLVTAETMKEIHQVLSKARLVAGFSVGEFAALCYSGAISFEDSLKLVKVQCNEFSKIRKMIGLGALCNIRGLSRNRVEKLCKRFMCSIANVIYDEGSTSEESSKKNVFVCGGLECNVERLVEFIVTMNDPDPENGSIVSSKKLRVRTANHTLLMKPALSKFRTVLAQTKIQMPKDCLVYSNVTGKPYRSIEEIRKLLPLQMIRPVKWQKVLQNIYFQEKCRTFVDCSAMQTQGKIAKLVLGNEQETIDVISFNE